MRPVPVYPFLALLLLISVIAAAGCSGIRSTSTNRNSPIAWRIDHAVIVVQNLTAAMDAFIEAGFNVVSGGDHADNLTETHSSRSGTGVTWNSSPRPTRPWLPRCTTSW